MALRNNLLEALTVALPTGLSSGTRAITTQSFSEAHTKMGSQFEGSLLIDSLAGGASNDTFFITGAKPVIIKSRVVSYTGSGINATVYSNSTFTGGSTVGYFNATDINPVTGLSQIIGGATTDTDGALVFAPNYLIGNASLTGKGGAVGIKGRQRILKPNTTYMLRLTSLDSTAQDVASFLTWYEGDLDLPPA
jgi:hypothetical protein